MPAKTVLITSLSDPSMGPRPSRMVEYCLDISYDVHVMIPEPAIKRMGVIYQSFRRSIFGTRSVWIEKYGKIASTILQKQ